MVKGLDASDTSDILSSKIFVREREEEYGSSPQLEERSVENAPRPLEAASSSKFTPGSIPI